MKVTASKLREDIYRILDLVLETGEPVEGERRGRRLLWMYTGETDKLSTVATQLLETCDLMISPIVQLELSFLHGTGRLTVPAGDIVGDLGSRVGLQLSPIELIAAVRAGAPLTWTREPFDRLIAGDALAANAPLLTKDHLLLEHLP